MNIHPKPNMMWIVLAGLWIGTAWAAQDSASPPGEQRGPPPQAYQDCQGKKPGDAIQHLTPEGLVPATCQESPEGLVARPINRPLSRSAPKTNQDALRR